MKLSQTDSTALLSLSPKQKHSIVFCNFSERDISADAALILGGRLCAERAKAAAKLYLNGDVSYLVPSGGVEWEFGAEKKSEAVYMTEILQQQGVPTHAILIENEARTTKENMLYATIQLNRALRLENIHRICIVTSDWHLKRSLALARLLLPRSVTVTGYGVDTSDSEFFSYYIDRELPIIKKLVDQKLMEDIEY